MTTTTIDSRAIPQTSGWGARLLSGLPSVFLVFDAGIKLVGHPEVTKACAQMGLPLHHQPGLGVLLLACLALYWIPRTAAVGAVLLTGYFGGAILAHLRVEDPLFTHTLFPVYLGALLWAGLYLREARVRALIGGRP